MQTDTTLKHSNYNVADEIKAFLELIVIQVSNIDTNLLSTQIKISLDEIWKNFHRKTSFSATLLSFNSTIITYCTIFVIPDTHSD